ncbi:DNA polymerase III subunit delta [Elizabethkingia argentiflava]|uniref:DNA polymerase III subunit delta n=1 Tax=Elizabethkingia argenteiflava TaxID=2681556 RepID=A0A845PR32_9FLAO|nr:DNA polymerase III subunit delta [Elizabethkingia argenteiflava]NAW50105.1 DNA polymerase III subunit delta [Elizabethkingia argenteiflava]
MKDLENILKNIKNNILQPIYFFHGEEPYFMDVALKSLENDVLTEDEKTFNQTVVYGKDTTYAEVLALARQYPMMGGKQLIMVKEAQDMRLTEEEAEALLKYIDQPVAFSILVIAHKYKKVDSRKKFVKQLEKKSWLHYSEPVKDYQLSTWIQRKIHELGMKTAPNISHLLAEYLGNDLSRISNELNKLKLVMKEGQPLDGKLVELHIGISKDYNVFELQKALGTKDEEQAMRIAYYMGRNMKGHPLLLILGNLFNYFTNILLYHTLRGQPATVIASTMGVNPYFLKDYEQSANFYPMKHTTRVISILREMDMKSKGLGAYNVPDADLLVEMVYKILNVGKTKVKV